MDLKELKGLLAEYDAKMDIPVLLYHEDIREKSKFVSIQSVELRSCGIVLTASCEGANRK